MKRIKVFQRTKTDCGTASTATLLGIPYEAAPKNFRGFSIDYRHYPLGKLEVSFSNIDPWLHINKFRWGKCKTGRFWWPWKYYIGILLNSRIIDDRSVGHMVVMRGRKIWHDPYQPEQKLSSKEIIYSMTLKYVGKNEYHN